MREKKNIFIAILLLITSTCSMAQITNKFTDSRDGKTYKTIKIGNQTWMAENLAYKTSGGCWSFNNDSNYIRIYGFLYDWETAKTACPKGWHLPTDSEWDNLIQYLGGPDIAGGKLKETGTIHWLKPNFGATDSIEFSALPGGKKLNNKFFDLNVYGRWWTNTEDGTTKAFYYYLFYDNSVVKYGSCSKKNGYSVRCVKN